MYSHIDKLKQLQIYRQKDGEIDENNDIYRQIDRLK